MSTAAPQIGNNGKNGNSKNEVIDITDFTQVMIIGVYLVQKLGRPTLREIQIAAQEKLNCRIDGRVLKRALQGASRAGKPIAILQERVGEGGITKDVYSMKDLQRWKSAPEFAHIGELLPRLLSSVQSSAIKDWFDTEEKARTEKGPKTTRGNDVDEYRNYSALIYTRDPLLGSQIHCPYTDRARGIQTKRSDDKPDMEGIFVVDELTGDRLLTSDCLSGWWITNAARFGGLAEARGNYLAFKPIRIPKHIKPVQLVLPVNSAKQGASAPKSYECIPPGVILKLEFCAPVKGVFSSEQYEKLLHIIGNRPRRGFSPARGKRYGRFLVLDFKDLGSMKSAGSDIDFIFEDLPEAIRKEFDIKVEETPTSINKSHILYMKSAAERLRNVEIRPGGVKDAGSPEPFPGPETDDENNENES